MAPPQRLRGSSIVERRSRLRILHVIAPSPVGGAERVVEALAIGHHRRGHDVAVATVLFEDAPNSLVERLQAAGVEVHIVRIAPRAYIAERRAVRALCRRFAPDVVHTHGYRSDVLDRGVAASLRIGTVTTIHGPSMNGGLKGALYERLQRANYRRFDAVVAVSAALRGISLRDGVADERLHLVRNGWSGIGALAAREDARRELGLERGEPVIGWVGRLIPVKGGDIFLDALQRMPQPRPVAVMIGHGSEEASLRRQARELGIEESLRIHPGIMDAARLFRAFDVFALSSRSEGLPVVLLEAMAAGVPIVATRVGGVSEAVGEEEARLVPPLDSQALALALTETLADHTGATARANRASARLTAEFGFEPWLERYEGVYRGVLRS